MSTDDLRFPSGDATRSVENNRPSLEDMTLRQLRRVASEYGISRYSRMRKDQLLTAIQEIQRTRFVPAPVARSLEVQAEVEATKFDVGQIDRDSSLASVDEELMDLPSGYGDCQIVLLPRDPQWAYTYWDIASDYKETLRRQGGSRLALRFYDVTDVNLEYQRPHSLQQYECDELAREWYLPIPVSDRDYMVEIGYLTSDGRWLLLARSAEVRIPPIYPTDWIDDQFITIAWEEELQGKTFLQLVHSKSVGSFASAAPSGGVQVLEMAQAVAAQHVAGSVFTTYEELPESAVSSYVFPSGIGKWAATDSGAGLQSGVGMYSASGVGMAAKTESGVGMYSASGVGRMSGVGMYSTSGMGMMSGVGMAGKTDSGAGMYSTSGMGMMSGVGMYSASGLSSLTASGMGMSGIGMAGMNLSGIGMSGIGMSGIGMSGIGMGASMPPVQPRKFWLIADAELIVYGATEPNATVTIGGRPIKLNSDGTFRFQMSFQDGEIDFPILAVAVDGEQTRSVHMKFQRETPERKTNTKEEAIEEWVNF